MESLKNGQGKLDENLKHVNDDDDDNDNDDDDEQGKLDRNQKHDDDNDGRTDGHTKNQSPKGLICSAVLLPYYFDAVESQAVAVQRPRQAKKSCRIERNSVYPFVCLYSCTSICSPLAGPQTLLAGPQTPTASPQTSPASSCTSPAGL